MLAANGVAAAVNLSGARLLTGAVVQMGNPRGEGGERKPTRGRDGEHLQRNPAKVVLILIRLPNDSFVEP